MVLALLGLPSVKSIVEGIVNFFFQDVAEALVPDFLKKASVATIKWLVAVPDPSTWTHIGQLQSDMTLLAVSLLSVSFTAATVRYLLVGLAGGGHPLQALSSTVGSAGMLVAYPWAAHQTVAIVNTLTNALSSFPVVGNGLQRTVGIMFGGALLVGSGGVFIAVLVIVGVVFAAVMFAMKVLILLAFALLYVTGPLVIGVRPLPELSHLLRAWGTVLVGVALVPVGWTILFATAGAFSLDATSFGSVGNSGGLIDALTAHVAGMFAALLTFYLAVKLPLGVLAHIRGALAGTGLGSMRQPTSGNHGGGTSRVADANARLRAGTLQAGRVAGMAAGALGAPAGGPLGAGARAAQRLATPLAGAGMIAGGAVAARAGAVSKRFSQTRPGQVIARSPRAQVVKRRVAAAGRVLADAPRQIREASRKSGSRPVGEAGITAAPATAAGAGAVSARATARAQPAGRGDRKPKLENGPASRSKDPNGVTGTSRTSQTSTRHQQTKSQRRPAKPPDEGGPSRRPPQGS